MQESIGARCRYLEIHGHQDVLLHFEDLTLGELVLADHEEVSQVRRVDFFVLGSNQQSSHAKKVQLTLLNMLAAQKLVDDVLGNVQSLWN